MSTEPHDSVQFERDVDYLVVALTEATRLAAEADQRAAERGAGKGILAGAKRAFLKHPQDPAEAAEQELQRFRSRLIALHRGLDGVARAQLKRDVSSAVRSVSARLVAYENGLEELPVRRRLSHRLDTAEMRNQVKGAIEAIIPPAAPESDSETPADPATPGSLLPPAARAFARGDRAMEPIREHVEQRGSIWWKRQIESKGIAAALPEIRRDVGGDPIEATRLVGNALGGVLIGNTLDPQSRERTGPAVVDPDHTTLVLGAAGVGKTTGVVGPYAALRASLGDNVVVVTPQVDTIGLILPTARALSGQEDVPIVDFGGQIVSPRSEKFVTWDVTRNCLTPEGAKEFATAFAGPKLPAREQLSNPELFGGRVADLYAAGAHIAAGMRELHGLDPYLNGMARVYDLIKDPDGDPLPAQLPEEVRAALAGKPATLRSAEALFRDARAYAESFNPRLRQIAFQEHVLRASGVPLSDQVVGEKLKEVSASLDYFAKSKQGDPMPMLLTAFKDAVPPREVEVMSPRPGSTEIEPKDLVRPGAGLSFVSYSQTGSTGLAAGAFTSQVLDAAIDQNTDSRMLRSMGSADPTARLSLVVDEGGAGRYVSRLPAVVTDTRQLGISALVSMTSKEHLRSVFGTEAGKFLESPCVLNLTPDHDDAAALAQGFGEQVVERRSRSMGLDLSQGSRTVTHTEQKESILHSSDIGSLPRGQAVMKYASDPAGKRIRILELPQFADSATVVGAVASHVAAHPEKFEPIGDVWRKLRPDLEERLALQRDPTAALGKGSPEALEAALAGPAKDPAVVARPTAEPGEGPAPEPADREPASEAAPEPTAAPEQGHVAGRAPDPVDEPVEEPVDGSVEEPVDGSVEERLEDQATEPAEPEREPEPADLPLRSDDSPADDQDPERM